MIFGKATDIKTAIQKPWDKNLQSLLAIVVAINVFPHAWTAPLWATAIAVVCVTWKFLYLNKGWALPKRWILYCLTGLATIGAYFQHGAIVGVEAASTLLVVLISFKLLETNRYRDAMLVIFTSYFLLMAHVLESQSLVSTVFMGVDILLITTLMFQLHKRDRRRSVRGFRPAMRMFVLTLPVWILFFFVFPRFTAAFWDAKSQGSSTGFSESLDPGSIESLVESDDPAFRATFQTSRRPSPEVLYWRGSILNQSNGMQWSIGNVSQPSPILEPAQPPLTEYEVFLEPGFQRLLFVLDYVKRFTPGEFLKARGINKSNGFTFRSGQDTSARVSYTASSSLLSPIQIMTKTERDSSLEVPSGITTRTLELAKRLKKEGNGSALEMAKATSEYFSTKGYRYTLRPGKLKAHDGAEQLDEFLFNHKNGFCEHFSAAFANLMRLEGVPARIVIGFQGGRYNEYGGYLLVRKLDAHAWTEIWIETGKLGPNGQKLGQWKRFDPTESVAPLRLALGGDYNRLDPQDLTAGLSSEEITRKLDGSLSRYTLRLQFAWDALQMRWNAFLINYDLSAQLDLLTQLGIQNASRLMLFGLLAFSLLAAAAVSVLLLRWRAKRKDKLLATWDLFCKTMLKAGVRRGETEGPLEFTDRAAIAKPAAAAAIHEIGRNYIELRYGQIEPSEIGKKLKGLKSQIRRLSALPL